MDELLSAPQASEVSETSEVCDGFKETEIGPIPVDWEVVPLQDAAVFTRKPKELNLSEFETIPFIPMELVPDNGTRIDQYESRQGDSIRSGTYCEKGDILLAKITPSFENGKQGIVGNIPLDFAYATTEVYPIRARPDNLDRMFLFHFFRLPAVRADIAGKMEGSTGRQRIPKAVVENYSIPLPPLPEQRRIAHVLSTIQRAIAAQDDLIAAAREVKRSLMQRLFTYGPGPEPAPTKETEIGEIPEHWDVIQLGDVTESSAFGPRFSGELYDESGNVATLRTTDLDADGNINYSTMPRASIQSEKFPKHFLQPGDFLVTRSGTCGIAAVFASCQIPVLPGAFLIRFRLQGEMIPLFLREYFNSNLGRARVSMLASGAVQKNIRGTALLAFHVPLPPLHEQQEIVHILATAHRKIETEEQRKAAIQALFITMLHQLMSGRIRV